MDPLPKKIHVFLLDDDEDDYLIIRSLLAKVKESPFILEWQSDVDKARLRIADGQHEVYLVDYRLGEMNGLELLSDFDLLKSDKPFVILTGAGDGAVEQRAMSMGVADYLVKGTFDSELLARVLRYAIQRKTQERQRVEHLLELNRTKDEFIALASHELRTPATAVKQYLGMVLEGYFGEVGRGQTDALRQAYDSNERQIHIINNILRVAQLDLENIVLQKQPTSLIDLVESVLADLYSNFDKRQQKVSFHKPPHDIIATVDPENLRMAISNIIENASKYSAHKTDITLRLSPGPEGHAATLSVKDRGVGIAEEDFGNLFRKFSRIHNPLSVKVGGNGLGLYWTKEVIELHGGEIKVTSKLYEGSEFSIII